VAPPASALYAHIVDPTSFGAMVCDILFSVIGSSGGFVATVDSDFQILSMFRRLGARLNVLRELIPKK
jgi:hypothetical protein